MFRNDSGHYCIVRICKAGVVWRQRPSHVRTYTRQCAAALAYRPLTPKVSLPSFWRKSLPVVDVVKARSSKRSRALSNVFRRSSHGDNGAAHTGTKSIAVAAHPGNWGTRNFSGPRFRTVKPLVLYEIVIPFNGNGIS